MHKSSIVACRQSLLASILCLLAFAECGPFIFISPYDETTDKGVSALQLRVDEILNRLDADPMPEYPSMKKDYESLRSDYSVLRIRNEARPKNSLTVDQLTHLKEQIDSLENQHRNKGMNRAMVAPMRDIFAQTFRAILKLELQKKEAK